MKSRINRRDTKLFILFAFVLWKRVYHIFTPASNFIFFLKLPEEEGITPKQSLHGILSEMIGILPLR